MKKNKESGLLKSFIEYFYGNFVVLLLGFISLPLITRVMTTDEYGRTAMFTSAVTIIYIFAILGLDQAYIRFFYKEGVDRGELMAKCLRYPFLLILLLSAVYAVFSPLFNQFLFGRSAVDITLLVIVYTVTSVFERFLFLGIRMEQNGKLYSNLNIFSKVFYIVLILVFVRILGNDFRVVLYGLTIPLVTVTVFLGIRFLIIQRKEKRSQAETLSAKELLTYGVPFVPMLLMEWLLSSMDRWSIKIFNDFSETGIYSAAMQIMSVLLTLKATYVAFWAPIAMKKYENDPEQENKAFFRDVFEKVQFLCLSAAFGITILRGIIVLILGEGYRDAVRILPFLTLMPILSILFEMTGQGIKFKGRIIYFNYASFAAILCNLIGNTLLVPRYRGVGAALATAITYVIYFAIATYFSEKCYPVRYDFKRFLVSLVLYGGYAAYATVVGSVKGVWHTALPGVLLLLIHIGINFQTVKSLLEYLFGLLRKEGAK
ncbi:MAG: oligosaccharide flippase family protein [Lachnospiraceae bacterium]|nr:oligosaccharide flippase family protein [Lachnospiraceae bacterium]